MRSAYSVCDELKLTCSYQVDEEEVVMHWLVNHERVQPRLVIRYRYHNYIGLRMRIEKRDLNHRNEISVRCLVQKFMFRVKKNTFAASAGIKSAGDRLMISTMSRLRIVMVAAVTAGVMLFGIQT
jgi:hypothetical protein